MYGQAAPWIGLSTGVAVSRDKGLRFDHRELGTNSVGNVTAILNQHVGYKATCVIIAVLVKVDNYDLDAG